MKTKTNSQKGFTLMELLIAAAAAAILILAAGTVIVTGQTSWNRTWEEVSLQRDASYAMLLITRSTQKAISATTTGSVLNVTTKDDFGVAHTIIFSYIPDTNNLQVQAGGLTQTILSGEVKNLQFGLNGNNQVTIDLSLQKGKCKQSLRQQ